MCLAGCDRTRASLTVEAAFVLPIFIFIVMSIIYLEKITADEEYLLWTMNRIARENSIDAGLLGTKIVKTPVKYQASGSLYLSGKVAGVSFLGSGYDEDKETINIEAKRMAKIPFPLVDFHTFLFSEKVVTKPFCGVYKRSTNDLDDHAYVYVTKYGTVYHKTLSCTHLTLSISEVKFRDLEYLRSVGGAKYYPCESCMKGRSLNPDDKVYICNYGNRYHCSIGCSKMSRSIKKVKLSEVGDRLPCSKCAKEE